MEYRRGGGIGRFNVRGGWAVEGSVSTVGGEPEEASVTYDEERRVRLQVGTSRRLWMQLVFVSASLDCVLSTPTFSLTCAPPTHPASHPTCRTSTTQAC